MHYRIERAGSDEDWAPSLYRTFENLGHSLDSYARTGSRIEVVHTDPDGDVCRWRNAPEATPVTVELTDSEIAALAYGYPHATALDKLKAAAKGARGQL